MFVAISPNAPPFRRQSNARPIEMRDQIGVAVALRVQLHAARQIVALAVAAMSVFLPANGGLPTNASKPPFDRVKTSGNSISQ